MNTVPDFDLIKQTNIYGEEYWSARELAPLLGYAEWRNIETVAIKKAKIACEQASLTVSNHFVDANKMVTLGSGSQRELKDYHLSRFACYLVAQNGDPRKPEIAAAQTYFAISTRQNELMQLYQEQQERLAARLKVNVSCTINVSIDLPSIRCAVDSTLDALAAKHVLLIAIRPFVKKDTLLPQSR